jgi:hypothetical protein
MKLQQSILYYRDIPKKAICPGSPSLRERRCQAEEKDNDAIERTMTVKSHH